MKYSRCQIIDHEQNEFIKVCLNKSCTNRRLCFICFEENKHQQHKEFQDDQIIRMTQFINQVEQIIKVKQQLIDQQNNQLIGIKKSIDDINSWFLQFTQSLNKQQDILKLDIEQTILIIQRLKNKQYNIDDVNNSIDLIQNKSFASDDFDQYLLRIEQIQFTIQDQLVIKEKEQQQAQLLENQQNEQTDEDPALQNPKFSLINNISQEIKCETYVTCAQLSPCGRFLAYAMGKKLIICQIQLQQFENQSKCQNEYSIISLKFSSDSCLLYFSDQQGYILGIQVNNNQERFKVQTQPCQIEQLFLINDVKFITLCLQQKEIRITKLDSPNYYEDSENESNQNSNSGDQTDNEIQSDQEYEFEISCEYYQSDRIEFDHLGYLQIDFNENDNLLVYPYDNNIWIQSYNTQKNFKRWLDEYDQQQSLLFKFSQDGKQLATVQNNRLFLYQVIVNQVTLLLIKKIYLTSEIYNLFCNDYCLFCDHGDLISIIRDNSVAVSEDLKKYHQWQDYYFTQQYNSSQAIILRRSYIFVMNLDSQV